MFCLVLSLTTALKLHYRFFDYPLLTFDLRSSSFWNFLHLTAAFNTVYLFLFTLISFPHLQPPCGVPQES